MSNWNLTIIQVFITICVLTAICICVVITLTQKTSAFSKTPSILSKHRLHPSNWTLIDLSDFRYVINNPICDRNMVHLLILIHTAPSHFHDRDVIRNTWGGRKQLKGYRLRTVFLLGAVGDSRLQRALETENSEYKDLVQGNFVDSYRNLTYKHVMGLQWAGNYCKHTRYVLKMDDDIFVDIYQLFDSIFNHHVKNSIVCYLQNQMPVVRDSNSKWYVSKEEYENDTFDNYCSGWAYLTNPSTAKLLVQYSGYFDYFWVDDVHITGTVAKAANVRLVAANKWYTTDSDSLVEWTKNKEKLKWNFVFGPTWGDTTLMTLAHQKAKWCQSVQCACCYNKFPPSTPSALTNPVKGRGIVEPIAIGQSLIRRR